jgi:hypothetical protein
MLNILVDRKYINASDNNFEIIIFSYLDVERNVSHRYFYIIDDLIKESRQYRIFLLF